MSTLWLRRTRRKGRGKTAAKAMLMMMRRKTGWRSRRRMEMTRMLQQVSQGHQLALLAMCSGAGSSKLADHDTASRGVSASTPGQDLTRPVQGMQGQQT